MTLAIDETSISAIDRDISILGSALAAQRVLPDIGICLGIAISKSHLIWRASEYLDINHKFIVPSSVEKRTARYCARPVQANARSCHPIASVAPPFVLPAAYPDAHFPAGLSSTKRTCRGRGTTMTIGIRSRTTGSAAYRVGQCCL